MKLLLLFASLFFCASLQAEIVECQSLKEITPFIEEGDLLLTEIDNIILKPTNELSSTRFFNHLKNELQKEGLEADEIVEKLYPLWVQVQKKSQMEICEQDLPTFLQKLKNQRVDITAFSQRGPSLALHTHKVLDAFGLHFEELSLPMTNFFFDENRACFFEGLLLMHPSCDKGENLIKWISELEDFPKRVVCIDYELVNLIHIKQALQAKEIPFLGIYYKDHDLNLSDYTIDIGNIQLQYLDKILPDSIANILVERD